VKGQVPPTKSKDVIRVPWLNELEKIVGSGNVMTSYADRAYYFRDHSTDFIDLEHGHAPDVVVLPQTEEQIVDLVKIAAREKISVTPRGAGTGFTGGAVAAKGGILIDLMQMNRIIEIDKTNYRVTAQTGATIQQIDDELRKNGLTLGFDPGSGPVASIGGAVSTEQLGKDGWYGNLGSIREIVLSLRVVLPDGTVVTTGKKIDRPTSSLNLTHLFVGAEGTLGIVTEVSLKVFPMPESTDLHVVIFESFRQAAKATLEMASHGISPAIDYTGEVARLDKQSEGAEINSFGMLLLGFAGPKEMMAAQRDRALSICNSNGGQDGGKQAVQDWQERHHEAFPVNLPNNKVYGMEGVGLPINQVLPVYDKFCAILKKHGLTRYGAGFGLAPSKLVVTYIFDNSDEGLKAKTAATEEMLRASTEAGGTISAAHGIGMVKRNYYNFEYDQGLLQLMRKIKNAIDPNGIMNPGKVVYT
jgi:FAD/FMN-containing dehydrogenase